MQSLSIRGAHVKSSPSMLRALSFASCYVYSPGAECASSQRSRVRCSMLKSGDQRFLRICAERVRQHACGQSVLLDYFDPSDILVPIPSSEPRRTAAMSATDLLAEALIRAGLGQRVWAGLVRVHSVRKSATAPHGLRPTVQDHYASFLIDRPEDFSQSGQFLLIDDVVTKGRTLMAAAMRMHESFPSVRIRAFAMLRTLGTAPGVSRMLDPCVGQIRWRGADVHRAP